MFFYPNPFFNEALYFEQAIVCLSACLLMSSAALAQSAGASSNGSSPGSIQGSTKVEGGTWEKYQATGVSWSLNHRWRVLGADSIDGVDPLDYAPDSSFEGPQTIRVHWADDVDQGLVQLGVVEEEGGGSIIDELPITVSRSLCSYYLKADWCPNTLPNIYTPTTRRNSDPIYVCGDGNENYVVTNDPHIWMNHRFEVYYYTESGARYKESWKERVPLTSTHAAQPFYIKWHATVPSLLPASGPVLNQTYQTDHVSYQPHYTTEPQYLNDTYGTDCRVGDRIVRAQIYSQSYGGNSSPLCAFTSSKSLTHEVYYGVSPQSSATLLLTPGAAFCINQSYTVRTAGVSTYATDYEFEWRDVNSGRPVGISTTLPASQVEVLVRIGMSFRRVVRAAIGLPAAAVGLTVALYLRPVRRNGDPSWWGCDGDGGWINTASFTAIGAPRMRNGIWFATLPVPLITTTQVNFHGASYATGYQYIALKLGSTTPTPVGIFPGNQAVMTSSSPNAPVHFNTAGRYQILVIPQGPCGQGTPIVEEFTIGGTPTAPNLDSNAPYELGFQTFDCNSHSGTTWITYPPLNPAWAYWAPTLLAKPNSSYRDFTLVHTNDLATLGRLTFTVSQTNPNDIRPIAGQYYLDLYVNSGVGPPIAQRYVIEDAICRPAPGGGSGGGTTIATTSAARVTVYPNPVTENELTVNVSVGQLHWVRLYDQQGNLVREKLANGTEHVESIVLPLEKLPIGLYLLRTFDGEQITTTRVSRN